MRPVPPPIATGPAPAPFDDLEARWAPALWAAGVVSAAVATWYALHQAVGRLQLDLAVYLMGGRHLVGGHLYQASLTEAPHLPFTYPPFAAATFAPLALLPERGAQVVGALVNLAALYALVWLSLRAACPGWDRLRRARWALLLLAPCCLLEPVQLTLYFGQVNLVLAAMVLADLTVDLRVGGRTVPRGVLIGVAAAVKLVPLVFVPLLFVTRQTRAAWTSLVTFAICSVAAAALDPAVSWQYWTKYAFDASRVGAVYYVSNQSLRGVADRLDHRPVSALLVTAVAVVVLAAGIALAAWAWRSSSRFLGVLVCAATGLLVSPITWAHHLVWVVPVLVWLVWSPDRPAGGRWWALATGLLFWWDPVFKVPYGGGLDLEEHGWQLVKGSSFFLATAAFLVGVAVLLSVRRQAGRDRVPEPAPVTAP